VIVTEAQNRGRPPIESCEATPRFSKEAFDALTALGDYFATAPPALRVLALVALLIAVLPTYPLTDARGDPAVAVDEPTQTTGWVTWHTDNFFSECGGNCALSVFGGPQVKTHMYDILIGNPSPPWDWKYGNANVVGGAISRRLLTLWNALDIEPEFGVAKRFGGMHADEAWLALYFSWTRFPWDEYLRTSIALTVGPSVAVDLPPNAHNAGILDFFSPRLTFALPQYPEYELLLQLHHRSEGYRIGGQGTPDPGWQYLVLGLRYHY